MSNRALMCWINIILIIILKSIVIHCSTFDDVLVRNRRQLLYLNSSVIQFNVGVATPTPAAKINVNWAFQANFQLPWNRTQIPVDILEANSGYTGDSKKKRDVDTALDTVKNGEYKSDAKLYHFYKYVEEVLDTFGENGTSCMLRMLCQLGAEPLHTNNADDLLHEIISYVLNPTNDAVHSENKDENSNRYIQAFNNGEAGNDCVNLYRNCTTDLIDIFTIKTWE